MKTVLIPGTILMLSACTVHRQADVSVVDANSGVVRLTYGQAILQSSVTNETTDDGTATRQCQQLGYATAVAFGQPITTCTVISGSLCLNQQVTLQYQCRGTAIPTSPTISG